MFHPYKLWSLWDMLRFYAHKFVEISTRLAALAQLLTTEKESFHFTPETYEEIKEDMNWLYDALLEIGLKISAKSIARIKTNIGESPQLSKELHYPLSEIFNIINFELEDRLIFILSSDRASYYNPEIPLFGKDFNDMTEDIVEAGNCFAMGRYTACVFHLMRVMEKGVQIFGKKLGVVLITQKGKPLGWQNILNSINTSIKNINPHDKMTKTYAAMAAHLYSVKLAWRNEVMHPKETYTDEEAKAILGTVEVFINELAKIL